MSWTRRLINSIRPAATVKRPTPGRVIQPRAEDTWRDYPSSGLTPSRLMAILRQADAGDPSLTMQLFEEMEEKDAHLYAVANTRRLALTGLEWQVISAADLREGVDRTSADEAAAYCREVLVGIDALDEALQFLSLALGRNIAVAPKRKPGRSQRHGLFPSEAQKNARIAAGIESIAGGSLMISPTEWMKGG